jgi:hypothetical protein
MPFILFQPHLSEGTASLLSSSHGPTPTELLARLFSHPIDRTAIDKLSILGPLLGWTVLTSREAHAHA